MEGHYEGGAAGRITEEKLEENFTVPFKRRKAWEERKEDLNAISRDTEKTRSQGCLEETILERGSVV